jgi:hypothetical protein
MGANHTNFKFSLLIDTNYYKFAIWVFPDGYHQFVVAMLDYCEIDIILCMTTEWLQYFCTTTMLDIAR